MSHNYKTDPVTGQVIFTDRYDTAATIEVTTNHELAIHLCDTVDGREMHWYPNRFDLREVVEKLCTEAEEAGL